MRRRFARQPFLLSQQQPASSKHKVKPTRAFLSAVAKLSFNHTCDQGVWGDAPKAAIREEGDS